jgi:hypothetical protein
MHVHDMVRIMASTLSADELHAFAVEFYNARMKRFSRHSNMPDRVSTVALPIEEAQFKAAWEQLTKGVNNGKMEGELRQLEIDS